MASKGLIFKVSKSLIGQIVKVSKSLKGPTIKGPIFKRSNYQKVQ